MAGKLKKYIRDPLGNDHLLVKDSFLKFSLIDEVFMIEMSHSKVNICGIEIDSCSFDEVVNRITEYALSSDAVPRYVITPNAHHILLLQDDAHFREIYSKAFLVVPDGVPLLWAAKFLGTPLSGRVNGTDLFEYLCKAAAENELGVFLMGGRPGAAEGAAKVLKTRYPNLNVVGTDCPPYGFEKDATELKRINTKLKEASPDLLFVGLGAPKQEKWMYANCEEIDVPISVGIGVSFEFVAGIVKRAPRWMQRTGLEWLFRLIAEPRRLWKRYILGNPRFLWLVFKQKLGVLR